MKNKRWTTMLCALGATLLAATAQAQQAAQTAEGAQRFLSTLVKKGNGYAWFVDAQGRTNYVRGKATTTTTRVGVLLGNDEEKSERLVDKQLTAFSLTQIDTEGADGKPDACMTRIAKWGVREPLTENKTWQTTDEGILIDTPIVHVENSIYELPQELASPHWIDWRNVKLSRSTNGGQMTASFKEKNYTAHLSFTGESELVDRVEYAMKFLKLSCDDTTATGF
ncbi:hypothetical protein J2X16_001861 [Pelomonas aquatica]|uniref:Uncharacterized protein n=1 Tax=Pelomonas aquatica TaxID=431058 RepID=A0ABU1Z7C3_9BURK|nr:hypothetical protein [Pelomonas aquatica]MDR7296522.1 hypothetical protein [Pelomonas aquatica]